MNETNPKLNSPPIRTISLCSVSLSVSDSVQWPSMAFVLRHFSLKLASYSPAFFFFSTLCRRSKNPIDPFRLPPQPPPLPKKVPFEIPLHERTLQDPYHWMSNTHDPDFKRYLELENSYSQSFMADTEALQRTLYEEMTSRMAPRISTPPERWGPWLYYQCIPEGKEFPVLCRRLETESEGWLMAVSKYLRRNLGREEILLDWNEVAEQYGKLSVTFTLELAEYRQTTTSLLTPLIQLVMNCSRSKLRTFKVGSVCQIQAVMVLLA